jgi:predicted metal-dependent enzyme (double-stranded beta helix superfamily)
VRFDVDEFLAELTAAAQDRAPQQAVEEVLRRAFSTPSAVAEVLGFRVRRSSILLHRSDDLTVQHFVMPPRWRTGVHDHRMWAVIATFGGQEDNTFFQRSGSTLFASGGQVCRPGDVLALTDDVIHDVASGSGPTGGIHVYGGDLYSRARSMWRGDPPIELPLDNEGDPSSYIPAMTEAGLLVP